jgi:tRNA(fMet)-specific endonuclease VapC
MQKTLLDTDVFSELIKGKNPVIKATADAYLSVFGGYTLSAV